MTAVRMLRWAVLVAVAGSSAAPALAAPDAAPDPVGARLRRVVDSVPAPLATLVAQGGASNVMFARIQTPKHRGYRWGTIAYKQRPAAPTRLALAFQRSRMDETQHQSSDFSWTLPRGALSMGRRLKGSSLVTRRAMGDNGSISMKLAGGSQYVRGTPEGCIGWIEYRVGVLAGRFGVDLLDSYFGKIGLRSARVALYREHDLHCPLEPSPPACPDDLWLSATDVEAGVAVGVFRTAEGRVDQRIAVAGKSGEADAVHRISVQVALPEAFEASDDLSSATVDADVAGPWLSGDLSYLAPPPAAEAADDCGPYRSTSGVVTGDFAAHFDAIGDVAPASTGIPATLRRQVP